MTGIEIYLFWGKAVYTQLSQNFPSEGAELTERNLALCSDLSQENPNTLDLNN